MREKERMSICEYSVRLLPLPSICNVYVIGYVHLQTEPGGVKPVRMENFNGCSSHATWTVTGYSQIVIVITRRTWLALGTIVFFLASSSSFLILAVFSSLYRSASFLEYIYCLAVATRSSRDQRHPANLHSSHARSSALYIPKRKNQA